MSLRSNVAWRSDFQLSDCSASSMDPNSWRMRVCSARRILHADSADSMIASSTRHALAIVRGIVRPIVEHLRRPADVHKALFVAALVASRYNPVIKAFFQRLLAAGPARDPLRYGIGTLVKLSA